MVPLLNNRQISQKITRLAIEMVEQNWQASSILLVGINNNGMRFAELLAEGIQLYAPDIRVELAHIRLNPANPLEGPATMDREPGALHGRTIILVDDVANTGRTLFYAFQPLWQVMPAKLQIAVLVDRKHKAYPVHVDYVGLSLATTLHEHIDVQLRPTESERCVYLT
jgi:pyrimidine operon attenuation protein/uracil phosphoribosyltransferase